MINRKKKSRIAPTGIIEKNNYYMMGDKYIRNFLVTLLPPEFGLGMLSYYTSNPNIKVYIKTSPLRLDIATPLNKEYKEKMQEWKKTKDIELKERLEKQLISMQEYIRDIVANNDRTLDLVLVFSIQAKSKEDLEDDSRDLKATLKMDGFRIEPLLMGQLDLFKYVTPLFSNTGFSKTMENNIGVPITTKSFAGMWPYTFETMKDKNGFLFAREKNNSGVIIWDPLLYLHEKAKSELENRLTANIVIFGKSGAGKTTAENLIIRDLIKKKVLVLWEDPENKNQYLTKKYGGTFIKWGSKNSQINIFDLKPISVEEDEDDVNPWDTELAIYNAIDEFKNMLRLYKPKIADDTLDIISEVQVNMYTRFGITFDTEFRYLEYKEYPILSDFDKQCEIEQEKYKNDPTSKHKVDALDDLRMKIKPMLTEHKYYFNGHTTINYKLEERKILSFGTKILMTKSQELRNAMNYIMFSYMKSICLDESIESASIFGEASGYLLEGKSAEEIDTMYRRSRKYRNSAILDTQEPQDLNNDLIKVHGSSIINNATYKIIMQLEKKAVDHLDDLITLNDSEKDILELFGRGEALFISGDKHMTINVLATEKELEEMDPIANG